MSHSGAGPLWAITSYFNPQRYARRRANYRVFRRHLSVPLVAVELSFDGRFDLGPGDAEIVIRKTARDVMWQKERLLNLALAALPRSCEQVVWIDCDVVFCRREWARDVRLRLRDVPLVQTYSQVYCLPPDAPADELSPAGAVHVRTSAAALAAAGRAPEDVGRISARGLRDRSSGFAWAARRELLAEHALYDACIIGGGDNAMVAAAYGVGDRIMEHQRMNERQRSRYLDWALPFYRSVQGQVAYIEADLLHLWHGSMEQRQYAMRHQHLALHNFDPYADIALDSGGCWRFSSDKPALHDCLRRYFASRQEDGPASASDPDRFPAPPLAWRRMAA